MDRRAPEVLNYIAARLAANDRPTYQELADECEDLFETDFVSGEALRKFSTRHNLRPELPSFDLRAAVSAERDKILEAEQKKELVDLLRQQARVDIIKEAIREGAALMPPLRPVEYKPWPGMNTRFTPEQAVLDICDLHGGYWLTKPQAAGLWEYDYATLEQYMGVLWSKVHSIIPRHNYSIPVLNLHLLGDMIENMMMRKSQAFQVEFGIREQCVKVARLIIWLIRQLLTIFEHIECVGMPGNHGRMSEKWGDLPPGESFDLIVYHLIDFALESEPRFNMTIVEADRYVAEMCGWRSLLTHGANIRGGDNGINKHNINVAALFEDLAEGIDNIEMGHFHRALMLPFRTWGTCFVNGSFTGATAFSLDQMNQASQPAQWMYGINEERPVTWSYKLTLAEPPKRR